MNKVPLLLLLTFMTASLNCFSQDLTCKDFHEGVFYADSEQLDKLKWIIIRSGNHQTEKVIENHISQEAKSLHEIIEWIDDCTYTLKYDPTFGLSIYEKFVNDCGGVLNRIIKIEGNCYTYTSTISYDGIDEAFQGKICMEVKK